MREIQGKVHDSTIVLEPDETMVLVNLHVTNKEDHNITLHIDYKNPEDNNTLELAPLEGLFPSSEIPTAEEIKKQDKHTNIHSTLDVDQKAQEESLSRHLDRFTHQEER